MTEHYLGGSHRWLASAGTRNQLPLHSMEILQQDAITLH